MDWPMQDSAHGKLLHAHAFFSLEEKGCDLEIYSFSAILSMPRHTLAANDFCVLLLKFIFQGEK